MKYWLPIDKKSPSRRYFMYIDVKRYVADAQFARNSLNVVFHKEMRKEGSDIIMILCSVPKKQASKMREVLDKLPDTYALLQVDVDSMLGDERAMFEAFWEGKE